MNFETWLPLAAQSPAKQKPCQKILVSYHGFYHGVFLWWRHQMETFSALLVICAGNSPVPGEFPTQRPVTRSFDVFFDLCLNQRLSKESWGWWFETLSCRLWRHCINDCTSASDFHKIDRNQTIQYPNKSTILSTIHGACSRLSLIFLWVNISSKQLSLNAMRISSCSFLFFRCEGKKNLRANEEFVAFLLVKPCSLSIYCWFSTVWILL